MNKIISFFKRHRLAVGVTFAILVIALIAKARGFGPDGEPLGFGGFSGLLSAQGGAPVTSFVGVIDPTNTAYGMIPCTSSCSAGVAEANRAALQSAVTVADTQSRTIYIPPGQYPIGCATGQVYGVDFGSTTGVVISGRNAILRFTGNQASSACSMLWIRNTANVKLEGLTISMRDVTNAVDDTVGIMIGDGGTTTTDYTQIIDVSFLDGVGGDYVRLDGGAATATVTRTEFERSRFDGAARAAINVRPGSKRVNINYNFFKSNSIAIWFEDSGAGPIGQSSIVGNFIESDSANPAVILAGHGGADKLDQSVFKYNRLMVPLGTSTGGGTISGAHLARTTIAYNSIKTDRATSDPTINLTGDIVDVLVLSNYVERRSTASAAAVIAVASNGSQAPSGIAIRSNRILQHSGASPGVDVSGCARCSVVDNHITYHGTTADSGTTGFVGIYCAGSVSPCSGIYARNLIRREYTALYPSLDLATVTTNAKTVIEYKGEGSEGLIQTITFANTAPTGTWLRSDSGLNATFRFKAGVSTVSGFEGTFNAGYWLRVKTPGTGTNVMQAGDAFGPTYLKNVPQAGRPLAGVAVLIGTGTTIGALTVRDNRIEGARASIYSDGNGSAAFPEGYPIISSNLTSSITNEYEGGIGTYRSESTSDTETLRSGAASINKHMTFYTTANTEGYTQADAVVDGLTHCYKVKSVSGSPAGTWTPTHFADGTTHTITWSTAGGAWCATWDATSTTYRLTSITSGVTLN